MRGHNDLFGIVLVMRNNFYGLRLCFRGLLLLFRFRRGRGGFSQGHAAAQSSKNSRAEKKSG